MASIVRRIRRMFYAGKDDTLPAVVNSITYLPLESLEKRLAAWHHLNEDPRRLAIYERVACSVDWDAYAKLQDKYRDEVLAHDERHFTKYLDIAAWFSYHARIAALLDIDHRATCSILDIGAGGGHFAAICQSYGHEVTVVDRSEPQVYGDLLNLFGVRRIKGGIYLGKSLPEQVSCYDLIVINGQVFDVWPKTKERWRLPEWTSFIEYLCANHSNRPGELFIGLNKSVESDGGRTYLWTLVDAAEDHGASIERNRATMHFRFWEPPTFDDIPHVPWLELGGYCGSAR